MLTLVASTIDTTGTKLTLQFTGATPPQYIGTSSTATGLVLMVEGTQYPLGVWFFGSATIDIAILRPVGKNQTFSLTYTSDGKIIDAGFAVLGSFTSSSGTNNSTVGGDLVTLSEVKTYMGLSSSSYDSILSNLITQTSAAIVDYLGHSVFAADYTEYQNGLDHDKMWVNQWPINSITSVTFDVDDPSPTVVVGSEFNFNPVGQIRFKPNAAHSQRFTEGWRNIKVIYNAGWLSVPDPLKEAALEAIKLVFNRSSKDGNIQREKLGDYEYEMATGGLSALADFKPIRELLAPYKSLRV